MAKKKELFVPEQFDWKKHTKFSDEEINVMN
jgi:hypothetical protein